jgi:parallel beta-helix repeat protein
MRSIVRGVVLGFVGCAALRGAAADTSVRTVRVPQDFATIQEAVDTVGSNAIIEVGPGRYGPVTIGREPTIWAIKTTVASVTLRGSKDAVIDGGDEPAVSILFGNGIVVDGFTVSSRDAGVDVSHGDGITVTNLTVSSAGKEGIRTDTVRNVSITGNRIESSNRTAISVLATTAPVWGPLVVTGNTVVSTGGDAIFVHNEDDASDMEITGNTVESAAGAGIRTECGMSLNLSENDIRATGGTGISVFQVFAGANVRGNTIADTGGDAIWINVAPNVSVTHNRVEGAGGDGVLVTSTDNARVEENEIADVSRAGIRIQAVGAQSRGGYLPVLVGSNEITAPAGSGIVIDDSGAGIVDGNSVSVPGVHGVEIDATNRLTVADNEVSGAGSCGFRLVNGARGNVLRRNTALDCEQALLAVGAERKRNKIAKSNRFGRRGARR